MSISVFLPIDLNYNVHDPTRGKPGGTVVQRAAAAAARIFLEEKVSHLEFVFRNEPTSNMKKTSNTPANYRFSKSEKKRTLSPSCTNEA